MYIFIRILGKNEFFFIPWILSDVFELDANVANFVYYGKTRMYTPSKYCEFSKYTTLNIGKKFSDARGLTFLNFLFRHFFPQCSCIVQSVGKEM